MVQERAKALEDLWKKVTLLAKEAAYHELEPVLGPRRKTYLDPLMNVNESCKGSGGALCPPYEGRRDSTKNCVSCGDSGIYEKGSHDPALREYLLMWNKLNISETPSIYTGIKRHLNQHLLQFNYYSYS
ncbi:hypothetical protein JTB14_021021 [Gonioctena quinquepunctata]|nr:hypothetical protein JTB14_021021 [Gonioctena quinquepunctata]